MIKDIIEKAIKTEGIIEMVYSKDGVTCKFYQLCNVGYSTEFGDKCLSGYPIGSKRELTFKIDRIKDIQLMWDFVFEENIQFEKSGIYILSFMGDNYIDFGLYNYDKGEKLLDHYQFDLWGIFAYHYIPYYSETNKNQWLSFDKNEKVKEDSIYVFAFTMDEGTSVDLEERFNSILTGDYFKSTEHSGIHYREIEVRKGLCLDNIKIEEGVNILAYSRCPKFSYENLGVHNDIRLGIKP